MKRIKISPASERITLTNLNEGETGTLANFCVLIHRVFVNTTYCEKYHIFTHRFPNAVA